MNDSKSKIKTIITDVKQHWNEPPKGKYMTFKEIVSYSGGGIGVNFICAMALNMLLTSTNVLIGNTIGIRPVDMYILYVISVFANIPLSGIRANMIDNTRSKEGKYRPYIIKMGIPCAITTVVFVWFPYNRFGALFGSGTIFGKEKAYVVTCIVVLLLNFAQNFFYYFLNDAYTNLIHVLSPNTQERVDVSTIKGVVYSLAPSILNLAMPIFAQLFTNNNMYDIRLYRYIYPPLSFVGIILCIVVYVNTKEKIVQARTHVIQIKFMDSLREVMGNKYFWVTAMAAWIGFLEPAMLNIIVWLYNYGGICNGSQYAVIMFFTQNASLVGMLIAPVFIRKCGKRAVLITTNLLNIFFIAMMFPIVQMIDMTGTSTSPFHTLIPLILLVVCFYLNNLMDAHAQILNPTTQADIRDYQQYISGERIDGMFSTITAFGGIITVATSGVINILYEKFGINEETARRVMNTPEIMNRVMKNGSVVGDMIHGTIDKTADISYFSLYDPNVLHTVLNVLIIASVFGAIINLIPYFFYDLTEIKQQGIVKVLKIRAFFEDFGNNTLSNKDMIEVIEMVETAQALYGQEEQSLNKAELKAIRRSFGKENKKDYKSAIQNIKLRNTEIQLAPYVIHEMKRFDSVLGKMQVEDAQMIVRAGLDGLAAADLSLLRKDLKKAKNLPTETEEEKEIRKYKIKFCRTRITAKKYYNKYYAESNGIEVPDDTALNELYAIEEQYDSAEYDLYKELFEAKENKDKEKIKQINSEINKMKSEFKILNKKISAEQNQRLSYHRSAKPILDAERVLKQMENYSHFDEIKLRYHEAKSSLVTE